MFSQDGPRREKNLRFFDGLLSALWGRRRASPQPALERGSDQPARDRSASDDSKFRIKEIRKFRPQALNIPATWPHPNSKQKHVIYSDRRILDRIKEHAASDTTRECFGLLLGNAYLDDGVLWIHLEDTVAAVNIRSRVDSVEVSTKEFDRLNEEVDRIWHSTDGRVRKIGWYHSHPGFGVFMSTTDRTNQRRYYNQDWQIALVVDPVHDTHGFFRGSESEHCDHLVTDVRAAEAPIYSKPQTSAWEPPARVKRVRYRRVKSRSLVQRVLEMFGR